MAGISSYDQLEDEALHLPREIRSLLASRLLQSLDEDDQELSAEWKAELDRRVKEIDEGRAKMIPADQAWEQINSRFGTSL